MTAESVLVEVCGVQGRVLARERVTLDGERRSFTIGRGVGADMTIDDDYVALVHVSVEVTPDGRVLASDLGSVNGIVVAGKRHQGASGLELPDGTLKIGHTRLRVRTERESLAPEKPDQVEPASIVRNPAFIATLAGFVCVALISYSKWLEAPRDLPAEIVPDLIIALLIAGGWIGFWALITRMTQWVWRWSLHAAILFSMAALAIAADEIVQFVAFAVSAPQWTTRGAWIGGIALGCALYLHLTRATSMSARAAVLIACLLPTLFIGTREWVDQRKGTLNVNNIDASLRIYPPQVRLRSAGMVDAFFQREAAGLRNEADRKRSELPAFEADSEGKSQD